MSIVEAFILGLLQGLTEFIPVSSSGHLLLAHEVFGSNGGSSLVFDVALHIGTLLALFVFFRSELFDLAANITSRNHQGKLARLLILATIPAAVVGLVFSTYIGDNLRTPQVVAVSLAVIAVFMWIADSMPRRKKTRDLTTRQGMIVGFAQAAALIPGVSRSGVTMTAGMFAGLSRIQAARFSFLLAIPIVAGSALGLFIQDYESSVIGNWQVFVGVSAAFWSGLLAIKFMLGVIDRFGLRLFAIYRLILAAIVLLFLV